MPSLSDSQPLKGPTKSGIVETADGGRCIPASTRADGSVRKEIRVRPGYRPPEDVEVYRNRTAQAFKDRSKGGVPGASFVPLEKPKSPTSQRPRPSQTLTSPNNNPKTTTEQQPDEPVDPELEKQKEARKLSKKLRQARDLQQKKEQGESLLPEQFQKVCQINELARQLNKLGFDDEGQKKDTEGQTVSSG